MWRRAILVVLVLLPAAGCSDTDLGGSPAAPPSRTAAASPTGAPAKDELIAALQRTQAAPHRFAVDSDLPENGSRVSASGVFDPVRKLYDATTTITGGRSAGTVQRIVVGTDSYLRQADQKTWAHLDLSRVKKDNPLVYFDMTDPTGLAKFIAQIQSVDRTGPHTYAGDFDPFVSSPKFLPIGAPSIVAIGGGTAPFTATTDEQNRVVSIHIELAPRDSQKLVMTTTFSEHGKPPPIKAPAKGSVQEADDVYYK
jgi:hypothetical protein